MEPDTLAIVAALALLVRFGHTLHTMGAVRARSVAAVAARSAIGTACVVLLVYVAGRASAWLGDGEPVEGMGVFFASPGPFLTVVSLALLPASLVGGATAERARVRGLFVVVMLLTLVALPALTSLGWAAAAQLDRPRGDGTYGAAASLSAVGRVWPLAAAHLVAAAGGLALARSIGPRAGKYNRDGSANAIPAHSLPTMVTGDLLLLVGLPLMAAALAGDPAARVVNALLAASAATLGGTATAWLRDRRVDATAPWAAAIGGVVAGSIAAPAYPSLAIALGGVVGLLMPLASLKVDLKLRVDEPSGLALPHLLGALAGLTGAAVGGALEGRAGPLSVALLASIAASAGFVAALLAGAAASATAALLRALGWLRVDEAVEIEGLDLAQHDVNAYPDFQQTMIKSYHLRQ